MRPYATVPVIDRPLEGDGTFDGLRHAADGGHEAVAHGLALGAAVRCEDLVRDALVLAEETLRPRSSPTRDMTSVWPTRAVKGMFRTVRQVGSV